MEIDLVLLFQVLDACIYRNTEKANGNSFVLTVVKNYI